MHCNEDWTQLEKWKTKHQNVIKRASRRGEDYCRQYAQGKWKQRENAQFEKQKHLPNRVKRLTPSELFPGGLQWTFRDGMITSKGGLLFSTFVFSMTTCQAVACACMFVNHVCSLFVLGVTIVIYTRRALPPIEGSNPGVCTCYLLYILFVPTRDVRENRHSPLTVRAGTEYTSKRLECTIRSLLCPVPPSPSKYI